MNRILVISLLTLTAFVSLLLLLNHQNQVASDGNPDKGYMCFNRGDRIKANAVMDFWRADQQRVSAVQKIVQLDYILIGVYVFYLCGMLVHRRKTERQRKPGPRSWLLSWLSLAIGCIVIGALVDGIQDGKIYSYVSGHDPVSSLWWWTWVKWTLLILGILPLLVPQHFSLRAASGKIVDWLSGLLNTIWTFFPSLIFIGLVLYSFWVRGQGKDILVAFTEVRPHSFDPARIVLFLTIGYWVYLTWYSSRVIAYIKARYSPIRGNFLDNYPRLAGNAGFLVLELAMLQAPILYSPLSTGEAFILFLLALILIYWIDRWVRSKLLHSPKISSHFWAVYVVYFAILSLTGFIYLSRETYLFFLFGLLVGLHGVYLFYSNLHHVVMRDRIAKRIVHINPSPTFFNRIMNFFCIPLEEAGYFRWFFRMGIVVIGIDLAAVKNLDFARFIGPLPIVILGFSMLLALGNLVTAFSARYRVNFHLLLFVMAFILGHRETHSVRAVDPISPVNGYSDRTTLRNYLVKWMQRLPKDNSPYDMYFILSDGGASRSGYWTASVLGKLEDACRRPGGRFSDHLFCLSGTSGGGVGVATFCALLSDRPVGLSNKPVGLSDKQGELSNGQMGSEGKMESGGKLTDSGASYEQSAARFLAQDYFSYTFARMLGPDYFDYLLPFSDHRDRAAALEEAFERYQDTAQSPHYAPSFHRPFSEFKAVGPDGNISLPILFVNTTRMQDGNPGLVTNLYPDTTYFGQRVDVVSLLGSKTDISMASSAILGARFPYLSPAGRIGNDYFVDGGYFDNSGAGAVQELIRGIINIARGDSLLTKQVARLRIRVLHIMNSPLPQDSVIFKAVPPIQNDLFSPVLTILGAYDMQTTVNDSRLIHYLEDLTHDPGIPTDYQAISLYEDSAEWKRDTLRGRFKQEPEYSMNWFMSDTTRNRIDRRRLNHPIVNMLARQIVSAAPRQNVNAAPRQIKLTQ